MELRVEDLANGVTVANLSGRMDIDGARFVDMQFNVLGNSRSKLVVDMSGVNFIASMGLRTLMTCARSVAAKGGRMAIAAPQPNVMKVLDTTGMAELVTISDSVGDAIAAVAG